MSTKRAAHKLYFTVSHFEVKLGSKQNNMSDKKRKMFEYFQNISIFSIIYIKSFPAKSLLKEKTFHTMKCSYQFRPMI